MGRVMDRAMGGATDRAAISVFVHGLYTAGWSVVFLLAPARVFGWAGLPPQRGLWMYVVALALALLAFVELEAARDEARGYFWLAILQRCAISTGLGALVYLRLATAPVMLLAVPEALFAVWTALALLGDAHAAARAPHAWKPRPPPRPRQSV